MRIAIVLSLVAGIVNVSGFLAFKQLTTNVTGHFALFINDVADFAFWKGLIYFLYIFSFLLGSFLSGFLIEKFKENKKLNVFLIPTLIEGLILIIVGGLSNTLVEIYPDLLVCCLLFAMGLQNSYVTKISNAVVRTTHLTGLFTDLGIDISQLFFPKEYPNREKLKAGIKLRISIISSFFLGGLIGGFLYSKTELGLKTLLVAALILIASLFYDDFRYKVLIMKRKLHQSKTSIDTTV
ncbi:YoaK family protein [Algoriphagus pacificus]|uniref:YoaK family protein n=1 Tax=Algoriphagus pacificus TaxID=2811234 RepID=UPI001F2AC7B6|nr:YoaK family protein [Algoriphagus pacificus]